MNDWCLNPVALNFLTTGLCKIMVWASYTDERYTDDNSTMNDTLYKTVVDYIKL